MTKMTTTPMTMITMIGFAIGFWTPLAVASQESEEWGRLETGEKGGRGETLRPGMLWNNDETELLWREQDNYEELFSVKDKIASLEYNSSSSAGDMLHYLHQAVFEQNMTAEYFLEMWQNCVMVRPARSLMTSSERDSTSTDEDNDDGGYCNGLYDTVSCWPRTPAGQTAQLSCPKEYKGVLIDQSKNATRICFPNATWQDRADYDQCQAIKGHNGPENLHMFISRIIYYVGFTLSIIALVIAFFIFLRFKSLRCRRNNIHCHLIMTFMLKNFLWLVMTSALPQLVSENTDRANLVDRGGWQLWTLLCLCKTTVTLFNYLQLTNFFWMLVEGLFLFVGIVFALHSPKIRLRTYVIFGWGAPVPFILTWAIIKATVKDEDVSCWLPVEKSHYELIIIVPIFFVLFVNLLILGVIGWVLITQIRESTSQYRRVLKLTLVLFPLLGLTYVLFITHPANDDVSKTVFLYFNSILQSIQGLLVAVIYCFLNTEVRDVIAGHARRYRDSRSVGRRSTNDTSRSPPRNNRPTYSLTADVDPGEIPASPLSPPPYSQLVYDRNG